MAGFRILGLFGTPFGQCPRWVMSYMSATTVARVAMTELTA